MASGRKPGHANQISCRASVEVTANFISTSLERGVDDVSRFKTASRETVETVSRSVRSITWLKPGANEIQLPRNGTLLRHFILRLRHAHQPFIEPAHDVLQTLYAVPGLA